MKSKKGSAQNFAKQRVIQLLKKKKMYEQQLTTSMQQQYQIENMQMQRENMTQQMETANIMKQGLEMQKEMYKQVDVDAMEDMQDEMMEMKQDQDYMNEMMNRNYNMDDVDEADLDEQLRDYEDEMFQEVTDYHYSAVTPPEHEPKEHCPPDATPNASVQPGSIARGPSEHIQLTSLYSNTFYFIISISSINDTVSVIILQYSK